MKIYNLNSKLDFGEYKGKTLKDAFMEDPAYIEECIMEITSFCFNPANIETLEDLDDEFAFDCFPFFPANLFGKFLNKPAEIFIGIFFCIVHSGQQCRIVNIDIGIGNRMDDRVDVAMHEYQLHLQIGGDVKSQFAGFEWPRRKIDRNQNVIVSLFLLFQHFRFLA